MSIFDKILGAAASVFPPANLARNILGIFKGKKDGDALESLEPAIQQLIISRDADRDKYAAETMQVELETRTRTIEAEMGQSDNYTKRARPTLVYVGLVMFFLEFIIRSILVLRSLPMPEGTIVPEPFIYGWTGAVSVWMVGRSIEKVAKMKNSNAVTSGSKILKAIMG
ncbi:hypothetical protein LCGC14_2147450 [marine sediment metagenome]|uniref:Holin of 3TMs, for gene-transfer release n=1 Tax=marine sediment metagenome TaxID=412755 RepID=A0A0F9EIQ0_9ZZZZ